MHQYYSAKKTYFCKKKGNTMKKIVFIIVTLLVVACSTSDNAVKEFAIAKVKEYYHTTPTKVEVVKVDYSFASPIMLRAAQARVSQANANYNAGTITKAEYNEILNDWMSIADNIITSWQYGESVDSLQIHEGRTMYKCICDDSISFFVLTDKDNKTPLYSTMDVSKEVTELVDIINDCR